MSMYEKNESLPETLNASDHHHILVVGAGVSGICLGIQLKRKRFDDFLILEKSSSTGGTWLDNAYPGCGCDVPSLLYSYSFASNNPWSRKYAPQPEILQYFDHCVDRYHVREHIRINTSVTSARWDDISKLWHVTTDTGKQLTCRYFISAVGQLSIPNIPSIDGADLFTGQLFHSARWPQNFETHGKRIGVIGNGATAIQIIPELAKAGAKVEIFQRSANWILPRHDHAYGKIWRGFNRYLPLFARTQRLLMYLAFEARILFYNRRTILNKAFTAWSKYRMSQKTPTELTGDVIPSFPAGCKRVLLSNNYLQSLHRENTELITEPIERINESGIETKTRNIELDAIVMATGFKANQFLYPVEVTGKGNTLLSEAWAKRPQTYLGILAPDFPNFCMLYGPNTNLGHNSIVFMVERQVNYLINCIRMTERNGYDCFEVTKEATLEFDQQLQAHLDKKVWNGYAKNWYTNKEGHITNNWCRSTLAYMWLTRRVKKSALCFSSRQCIKAADTTPNAC